MKHEDPFELEQLDWLRKTLGQEITPTAIMGMLIFGPRLIDTYGNNRVQELEPIFCTHTAAGKQVLRESLEALGSHFNSVEEFETTYPVTIIPANPAYPIVQIVGISRIVEKVYRVFPSWKKVMPGDKEVGILEYLLSEKCLPPAPLIEHVVLREKPTGFHWCSYHDFPSPKATAAGLQIWDEWSDCAIRLTIPSFNVEGFAYLPYNGDPYLLDKDSGRVFHFETYNYEPLANDHPPEAGGATQIAVTGAPAFSKLEKWNEAGKHWEVLLEL